MAQIDLGKLKFNFMGEWNNSTAYKKDDVVYYEGSTYVYRSDVNANGGTPPQNTHLGSVCDLMALGINYRGAWQGGTTYYKGDLVDWQNAKYLFIGTGNNNVNSFSPTAVGYTSLWTVLIPANPADVLTTSGDLLTRENDGIANVRLPIGKKGQTLKVIEKPDQDLPNDKNFDYAPFTGNGDALGTGMVRWLLGDERETYESITYTVTVAQVGSQNQFHISGGSLSGTVERPTLDIKIGSQYIFDVSDASNTGHVFAFRHWTGSSYPEVAVEAEMGITRSGTAGQAGATVTWVPTPASQYVLRYFCSAHSSMSDGIFATNFTRGQQHPVIYRSPTQGTAVKLSKGKTYTFTLPANQRTYSIKDTADSNYNPTLTGGRYEKGVSPTSVTNGGAISFTVPDDAPQTLSLEDQNGGGDSLTFSIRDRAFVPSYGGGDFNEKNALTSIKDNYREKTAGILQFTNYANMIGNTYTESLWALPDYLKKVGRGLIFGGFGGFYRQYGFIANREYMGGGNMWHNGSYDYTYGGGMGYDGQDCASGTRWYPSAGSRVQGYKLRQALAGNTNYAHLLTDLLGNSCDMLDDNGNIVHRFPKLMQVVGNRGIKYFLYENGMVWFAGYNGYGLMGDGGTRDRCPAQSPMKWYDESTSELKDANFPKIKQIVTTHSHTQDTSSYDYGSTYAVDIDGNLYSWGYNGYGQLGDGTTNGNYYAKRVPSSVFNGEKILYVMCSGYRYTHTMVITESGKCWATGYGDQGQLGLNNTSSRNDFAEVTAVSGSPLNGKKIVHILMNQDGDAEGRTWWLTDEGKVYYAGYFRDYGQQTGVYDSSGSGTNGMPRLLTNSSTLWNSDDQKVIYMASTNNRYSTLWFITDGGSTGMEQKIYATASNYHGIQGTNISPNSHTNDPAQGNGWFGGEILFSDFGDYEDGGDNNRPNEAIGNWASFQDGGSNEKKMKIGKIVEIIPRGTPENTYNSVVLVDEHGSMFICGYWNYTPSRAAENDNQHYLRYQDHWVPYFIHWPDQPSQILQGGFVHTGNGTENGWFVMSRDGNVLQGGENSWYQRGNYNDSGYSTTPPSWATLDTNG